MTTPQTWPTTWTREIGRAIARRRRTVGMSAQDLADACADHGFPIQRGAISKLENSRETITLHELVVIARALGVAPADLLFPGAKDGPQSDDGGDEVQIEYMPGMYMPASAAWKNFHGRTSPGSVRLVQASIWSRRVADTLDQLVKEQREDERG